MNALLTLNKTSCLVDLSVLLLTLTGLLFNLSFCVISCSYALSRPNSSCLTAVICWTCFFFLFRVYLINPQWSYYSLPATHPRQYTIIFMLESFLNNGVTFLTLDGYVQTLLLSTAVHQCIIKCLNRPFPLFYAHYVHLWLTQVTENSFIITYDFFVSWHTQIGPGYVLSEVFQLPCQYLGCLDLSRTFELQGRYE